MRIFLFIALMLSVTSATPKKDGQDQRRKALEILKSLGLDPAKPADKALLASCQSSVEKAQMVYSYFIYVQKYVSRYHEKFGKFPKELDSLSAIDSVDYSYMKSAWNIRYECVENCKSFSVNGLTQEEFGKLVKGVGIREYLEKQAFEALKNCINSKR